MTVYARCHQCGAWMATNHDANGRPRIYCSGACRQRACRSRHKTIAGGADVDTLKPLKAPELTARGCRDATRSVETHRAHGSQASTTTAARATPKRALTS